jgi:peptidoglycan/LPS O-acetylase OafA/YrhL
MNLCGGHWEIIENAMMFQTIQLCRAAAAILVVLLHTSQALAGEKYFGKLAFALKDVFSFGGEAGVVFFFVLSGFIISHVHHGDVGKPIKIIPYLRRRVTRIYPTYFLIFFCVYFAAAATPSLRNTIPTDPIIILKSLLLLPQDADVVGGTGAPVLIVAWSLQYEVVFYLVFAIAILSRWIVGALVAFYLLAVLAIQATIGTVDHGFPWSFIFSHLVPLFGMGILASVAVRKDVDLKRPGMLALLASAAFLVNGAIVNMFRSELNRVVTDTLFGMLSAIIIVSLVRYESTNGWKHSGRLSLLMGGSSYALYLMHYPIISVLCKLSIAILPKERLVVYLIFPAIVVISISAALLFHIYIENPLLRRLTPAR